MKRLVGIFLLLITISIICFIYFFRLPSRNSIEVLINGNGKVTKKAVDIIQDLQSFQVKSKDSSLENIMLGC